MAARDILNLAGPPRDVPLLVRIRVLLGGFLNQFGWIFLGFGLVFVWMFTANADLTSWYHFRGQINTAEGTVIYSKKTRFSIDSSKHGEDTPVYAIHYAFTGTDGAEYKGVSFNTGKQFDEGQTVTVEHLQDNPQVSRIKGMRRKPIGFFGLSIVTFPLIGIFFITIGIRKGVKANRLLALGEQTTGRLKSKEKTNTKVNNKPVYKLTFEFNTPEGMTYEAIAKTHDTAKLEDQTEEPLLYDSTHPSYAVMLANLPGNPRIMENGTIRADTAVNTLKVLVIPFATIIGHGIYIYLKFLN